MTSPRQIEELRGAIAGLQFKLAVVQQSVAALHRDVERAAKRHGWLADWNRLTAQQQFAFGQIVKGYRRGVNPRTVESLERLGLIAENDDLGWCVTEAGARLAEGGRNADQA